MNTTLLETKYKQIDIELENLKQQVQFLHSFLISLIGEDKEGKYNPKFVKEILESVREIPSLSFQNVKTFLKEL